MPFSLSVAECPPNDQVKCRRFSTHGAVCIGLEDTFGIEDPGQLTWDLNTVKKDTDKCFKKDEDDKYTYIANNPADISYVLYSETKNIHNKISDVATVKMLQTTSPYCEFKISDTKHQHFLYTSNTLKVPKPDELPSVEIKASENNVIKCCINSKCEDATTDFSTIDLSDDTYRYGLMTDISLSTKPAHI